MQQFCSEVFHSYNEEIGEVQTKIQKDKTGKKKKHVH